MLFAGVISLPKRIQFRSNAVVLDVRSFWWVVSAGVRAMTLGNVVLLGPDIEARDLEHELVHIEQAMREPLIHPILSVIEQIRYHGMDNKYEREAYSRAGNIYREK